VSGARGRSAWPWLPGLAALAVAGCAGVDPYPDAATAEVGRELHDRVGYDPRGRTGTEDDGTISADVRMLLQRELTEENAVRIALLNQREVRAAYESLGIARAELVSAGLLTNPVFAASARFFSGGTELDLGLSGSFLDLFFVPLRKRAAAAELAAAQSGLVRDLVRLAYDVRRAFVRVRAAQELIAMRAHVLRAAEASHELMARLQQAGNVTDLALTSEEVAVTRARIDLAAAESALVEAREPLNVLLGLWGEATDWRIGGRVPDDVALGLDLERVESRAIAASLELRENRAHVDAAAQRAGLASWEPVLPEGSLGVGAAKEHDSSSWGLGPSVGIGLPLFDPGRARSAAARARVRQGLLRHTTLAIEVRAAARTLRERALSLGERVAYIRGVHLPVRHRLVRQTLQYYNAMQVGAFDVLLAKQQEIEAGRELLETLREAWLARLDLEELLAGSFNRTRIAAGSAAAPSGHGTASPMNRGH
jgi:cobalt-zinc-cadmium efflux system outer membrane protein